MQVTAVKWHPPVKMARDGLVEKDDKHDVAQVLSMIAESDESGSDMELSDLEIGGSESEDEENSAVVSPKPSTSRGHEPALITVGPPTRPRRPSGAAGLIANDPGELSEDDGTAAAGTQAPVMQWVAVTDLATCVCPELPGFTEVNAPVNTHVDATQFVSP